MLTRLLVFVFVALAHTEVSEEEGVLVVTGSNFEEVVKNNPQLAVEFYAPWCGHCKKLAPEWATAAQALKKDNIALAKCDATEHKELASKFGVKGYPTIKVFRGDPEDASEYKGPRDSAGIISYMGKQFGAASKELKTEDEVADFVSETLVILGVFSKPDSEAFKVYTKTSEMLRDDYDFAHVFDSKLVAKCKEIDCGSDTVLLFKPFDELFSQFDGKFELSELKRWIESKATPSLPELGVNSHMKAVQAAFQSETAKFIAMAKGDYSQLDEFKAAIVKAFESIDDLFPVFAEAVANDGTLKYFGVGQDDTPAWVIFDQANNAKFVEKKVDVSTLSDWLQKYKDGKLEKTIKSEEIPEENDGPVKVIVAKSFEEEVMGNKDVLIEFYAPWCGHCKKLAPIYEKIGEKFKENKSVVIAKMDATANDVPRSEFNVRGFPTLYFVTGSGEIIQYSGDRSEADLIKFVEDKADSITASTTDVDEEEDEEVSKKEEL
eukprot:TRINITY_DN62946_c0_g1_i1.p1 TRINITY_DN62946_c0_g1~~TRINITY_DN62946_c0_g1_i1.p1  ORF type:complete len:492 (-),score=78.95 TRINITY_DN62946_c0_g1_i1:210-1685(-)